MSLVVGLAVLAFAATRPILELWPGGPPNGWHRTDSEFTETEKGQTFKIVHNVSKPTLEIFQAAHAAAHSPTVIVCPGGGYYIEAIEHEGWEIAERLNKEGFNAAVLKYRLPNRDTDKPLHIAPLQDAQRAIRLLRLNAAKYGIDPDRVGIMGFSAGGHLAAVTSNTSSDSYARVDEADDLSARPAFTVLIYPAYLDTNGHPELNPDIHLSAQTPPVFISQANDDPYVISAYSYGFACSQAKVPAEVHIFPSGGHGYGLRTKVPGVSGWMDLLAAWLKRLAA